MSGLVFQDATEVSVGERDGQVGVTFARSGDLSRPMTVQYDVTTETATPGEDYRGSSGSVRFAAGQDRATVTFDIVDDVRREGTETFAVSLLSVDSGAISVPRTCRVNILDDENPELPPSDPPLVSDYDVVSEPLIRGLSRPINIEFSPVDPGTAYVAEQSGLISAYDVASGTRLGTFVDIRDKVNSYADKGLIDIALHPDFPDTPYLYAFYTVDPPDAAAEGLLDQPGNRYSHLVRFTADAGKDHIEVVPGSAVVLMGNAGSSLDDINGGGRLDFATPEYADVPSSEQYVDPDDPTPPVVVDGFKQNYLKVDSPSHAGGALAFGPDGMLYVSTGDGGSANYADPHNTHVQDLDSLSGKILRIDPITGKGLADNPFHEAGQSLDLNVSKVFQLGLRNPFSMGFDDKGRLFIADTGWKSYEEVNTGPAGANFGWPYYEGRDGGRLAQTTGYRDLPQADEFYADVADGSIQVLPPYAAFSHAESAPGYSNQVITGSSFVYSGDRYPAAFDGDYFFTNFSRGHVFTVDTDDRLDVRYLYTNAPLAPVHFAQGPDGYVYYIDYGDYDPTSTAGEIGRLRITEPGGPVVTASVPSPVAEGADATVTFRLDAAQAAPVTVTYATVDGSAEAGADYAGVDAGTVVIPAGARTATAVIPILGDGETEPLETFSVVTRSATLGGERIAFGPPVDVTIAPAIGVGSTEAETLALAGYVVEPLSRGDVSGGAVIRTGSGGGTAEGVFAGAAGRYALDVHWLNEDDGAASFAVLVDGVTIDSWTGTGGGGGTGTPTVRSMTVDLEGGERILIEGAIGNGKEYARIDRLDLSVDDGAPPPPPPPPPPDPDGPEIGLGLTEAETLALAGYVVEPLAGASGGSVIRTGKSGGTADGVFAVAAGSYFLDVTWLNENDGAATFAVKLDGVTVDSWTGTGGSGGTGEPVTRRIALDLQGDERLTIEGDQGGFEYARIDRLDLSVDDGPIDPLTDAFDFFAFAGQSNAEGHFVPHESALPPPPYGADVFEAEIARLTGVDTTPIEAALGGSGSNQNADSQKYWWHLDDDAPGPALIDAIATIGTTLTFGADLDGIIWAQGEDDMTRIRTRGHDEATVVAELKTATVKVFEYFRAEFGDVPIFIQELGEFDPNLDPLRAAQRELIADLDYVHLGAETASLDHVDDIHFTNGAYGEIAERLAAAVTDTIGTDGFDIA
jgi:glucose/arabinose dehydrogenase